jgi:hypothetical protein
MIIQNDLECFADVSCGGGKLTINAVAFRDDSWRDIRSSRVRAAWGLPGTPFRVNTRSVRQRISLWNGLFSSAIYIGSIRSSSDLGLKLQRISGLNLNSVATVILLRILRSQRSSISPAPAQVEPAAELPNSCPAGTRIIVPIMRCVALQGPTIYSYRKARIGSISDARRAGM